MKRLLIGLGLAALAAGPAVAETGRLVIAGGAVDPANDALYGAFIAEAARHARDPRAPRFVIVPAGSAEPHGSAEAMIGHLVRRGVARESITVARIAPSISMLWTEAKLSSTATALSRIRVMSIPA